MRQLLAGTLIRFRRGWREAALIAFNFLVLLVVLNLGTAMAIWLRARVRHESLGTYVALLGFPAVARAYPGWTPDELKVLLKEHQLISATLTYDSATQFRSGEFHGKYVNVSGYGFRLNGTPQPWPPSSASYNVFLFGGSTAFGSGVPDDQTIGAWLQRQLANNDSRRPVQVYNFGVTAFYSSQERALFEKLLASGVKPDVAIFIDGLNEFLFVEQAMTKQVDYAFRLIANPSCVNRLVFLSEGLPVGRVARGIHSRRKDTSARSMTCDELFQRWSTNRKMIEAIAASFEVRTLFVWQPVPTYRYRKEDNIFGNLSEKMDYLAGCYNGVEQQRNTLGSNFIWLADIQSHRHENLYVDPAHYTSAFNSVIAHAIATRAREY